MAAGRKQVQSPTAKPATASQPSAEAATPLATLAAAEHAIEDATIEAIAPEPAASDDLPAAALDPAPASTAAAPDLNPIAAVSANTAEKDPVMATVIDNAADKTQAQAGQFFAEAKARSEDALGKSAKLFEEMNAFAKGNVEAVVESSKIAARGFETLGQDAADNARKAFEGMTAAAKTLSGVKSPTEFFKLQGDYARSAFDTMVSETSRSTEAMLKLAGEVAQPISNRFAVAVEKAKISA